MKAWLKFPASCWMFTLWKSKWVRRGSMVIVVCMVFHWGLNSAAHYWYTGVLPMQLGVDRVLNVSVPVGLMDPCGAVVFKLDDATAQSIRKHGLAYLKNAHTPRQVNQHPQLVFGDWLSTPYLETGEGMGNEDRWITGLSCTELPAAMKSEIEKMLRTPGTYVSRDLRSRALLVSPAKQWVVLLIGG